MQRKCKFLIIPQLGALEESLALAEEYGLGFEYNDFFIPDIMDDEKLADDIIRRYKAQKLPEYCTMHGAFFDVIIFSSDKKIRKISEERIIRSLDIVREIGAKGVVFHTNLNPDLTSESYIKSWLDINESFWRMTLPKYPDLEIYMENMFDRTPDMLCGLAKRLEDITNFGVCFDYAHAAVYGSDIDGWVCEPHLMQSIYILMIMTLKTIFILQSVTERSTGIISRLALKKSFFRQKRCLLKLHQ